MKWNVFIAAAMAAAVLLGCSDNKEESVELQYML